MCSPVASERSSLPAGQQSSEVSRREKWLLALGSAVFAIVFSYPLLTNIGFDHAQHDWPFNIQLAQAIIHGWVGFSHVDCAGCPLFYGKFHNLLVNFVNPESRILTPFILLHLVFGPVIGLHLEVIAHIMIGFAGAYMLARVLGASSLGAVACAATFQASSGYYLHSGFGHVMFMGYTYAPWVGVMFCRERLWMTAGFLALIFFECGTYPFEHVVLFLVLFAAALSMSRSNIRPLWLLAKLGLLTLLLSAPRLVATLLFYGSNPRPWPLSGRGDSSNVLLDLFVRKTSWPPYAPDPSGYYAISRGAGWEFSCYVSPLFAGLALVGVAMNFRRTLPWLLMAVALLITAAGPFSSWSPWVWLHHLPGWGSQRLPARLLLIATLPIGVLAAFGADALPPRLSVAVIALGLLDCWLVGPPNLWQAMLSVVAIGT